MSREKISVLGRELFPVEVMAEKLGYTAYWVRNLCREKKLPATRIGRRWWINESDALKALGHQTHDTEQQQPEPIAGSTYDELDGL